MYPDVSYIVPQNNLGPEVPDEIKEMFFEKVTFELGTEG